jgi:hypothetical protein
MPVRSEVRDLNYNDGGYFHSRLKTRRRDRHPRRGNFPEQGDFVRREAVSFVHEVAGLAFEL